MEGKKQKRPPKPSVARLVMGMIGKYKMDMQEGKDNAIRVIAAVKAAFKGTRFDMNQWFWYLARYRRQKELGLPLDRLVLIPRGGRNDRESGNRPSRKHGSKAIRVMKKAGVAVKVPVKTAGGSK